MKKLDMKIKDAGEQLSKYDDKFRKSMSMTFQSLNSKQSIPNNSIYTQGSNGSKKRNSSLIFKN